MKSKERMIWMDFIGSPIYNAATPNPVPLQTYWAFLPSWIAVRVKLTLALKKNTMTCWPAIQLSWPINWTLGKLQRSQTFHQVQTLSSQSTGISRLWSRKSWIRQWRIMALPQVQLSWWNRRPARSWPWQPAQGSIRTRIANTATRCWKIMHSIELSTWIMSLDLYSRWLLWHPHWMLV